MTDKSEPENSISDRDFVTRGITVLTPLLVTAYIVFWIIQRIDNIPGMDFLEVTSYEPVNQLLKLTAFLFGGTMLVLITGRFTDTKTGFKLEKALDSSMNKIPLLGQIYNTTKTASDTVLHGSQKLTQPVKLEFNGLRLTAYKTGNRTEDGREIIFLPTSPNVTTGLVIEAEPGKLSEPEEPVEQILQRTFSAGFGEKEDKDVPKRKT